MSLVRAFTTRKAQLAPSSSSFPQRSLTTKNGPTGTIRHKISAPVELISTTNMLSYNAPDIYPSSSSSVSGDESDVPTLIHSRESTPDNSSVGSSPSSPIEPNHLSCYFDNSPGRRSTSSNEDAPSIPSRALSHTKRNHEILHHQRSMSRLSSQRKASVASFARDSIHMFSANPEAAETHPFSHELAKVTELAEEYGVQETLQVIDEEEEELRSLGLFKFCADDYVNEIAGLFSSAYGKPRPTAMWI